MKFEYYNLSMGLEKEIISIDALDRLGELGWMVVHVYDKRNMLLMRAVQ